MNPLLVFLVIAENRYIAKTLYGTEEEEDASQPNSRVEEPKLLGVTSGSYEKVCFRSWPWLYAVKDLFNFLFGLLIIVYEWALCFPQVLLKSGPYGVYVQLGEDRKGYIPRRASVSHVCNISHFQH